VSIALRDPPLFQTLFAIHNVHELAFNHANLVVDLNSRTAQPCNTRLRPLFFGGYNQLGIAPMVRA